MSLSIHVRAIENTISIDLLILEILCFLGIYIRISFIPHVVLMSLKIILLRFYSFLCLLFFLATLVKSSLKTTETVTEIAKDISSTDLDQRFISSFKENHEFFVHMPKNGIPEHLIDDLPIASDHALLVQIDIVALDEILTTLLLHQRRHI